MTTDIDDHVESTPTVPNNFIKIEPQPKEQFPSAFEMNSELDCDINADHLKRNLQGYPTLERHVETPRRNVGFVTFVCHV
jgi:hypothetical protein